MLIQKEISNVIDSAKAGLDAVITKIKSFEATGDDSAELKTQLIFSIKWIDILIDYVENNFDNNGNIVPPTKTCLTQTEISLIMFKLTTLYGNTNTGSDWLLKDYVWDDQGFWRDSAFWNEVKTIT